MNAAVKGAWLRFVGGDASEIVSSIKCIACRANSSDKICLVFIVEHFSQPADMDVDRAGFNEDVVAPYEIQNLLARKNPPRVLT